MTNTAITDPEILERRFPVRLECFQVRSGSGGAGEKAGGDGILRRIRFREPVTVSLLTQHRKTGPFGIPGGSAGQVGEQWKIDRDGQRLPLPGNVSIGFEIGELIEIKTPGGGGFGGEIEA